MLGLPPQTRTQRTFYKKSFGISKTFAKVKWCFRWEILLPTFLIRKVGRCEVLCTPFSERKVCLQHFLHKNTSASETYNCNFSFNGKIRIYFAPQKALFLSNLRKISKLKRNKKFHKNTSKRILHKNRRHVFSLLPLHFSAF